MQPTSFFGNFKQKLIDFWNQNKTRKRFWIISTIIVIIILIIAINKPAAEDGSVAVVERRDVADAIVLSGRTQSGSAVELNFADSGRISFVPVKEGDKVRRGQTLASLESGQLSAELTIARAGLVNTTTSLEKITREQDALVENAYRALLSEGLEAVSDQVSNDATPPIVTGTYTGREGSYILKTYSSGGASGYSFLLGGLESGTGTVSSNPSPLGTKGLFITFDANESYAGTEWMVEIPNKRSSAYISNYNAYQSALATRERVIADAKADLSGTGAEASIAQARVDSILAQIAKRRIVAPFDGVIANLNVKVGETSSADSSVTLISESDYEVVLKAPEIDIAKLSVGQMAEIKLDAYGDAVFAGTVVAINPGETIIDGVPVYETKVLFTNPDTRIRSGMTATATITPSKVANVLAIPSNFIHTDKDTNTAYVYVLIDDGKKTEKRIVTTGLKGSDSYVEIIGGLAEGEKVRLDELK